MILDNDVNIINLEFDDNTFAKSSIFYLETADTFSLQNMLLKGNNF